MPDPAPFTSLSAQTDATSSGRSAMTPIILILDRDDGRQFAAAVADMLTALDAGIERLPIELSVNGRRLTIEGTPQKGLRITVAS